MVEAFLEKLFSKIKVKDDIKAILCNLFGSIYGKIAKKNRISTRSLNLNDLIEKNFQKLDMADVDLNIRKARLREAKRAKRELELKLQHVTESIQDLNQFTELTNPKPSLMDSQVRHDYFEQQKEKSKKVQKKTKEYYEEQKRRQAKMQKHLQDLQREIDYEREQKMNEIKAQEEQRKKSYEEYLKKIKEKGENRKRALQESKSCAQSELRTQKPLYVKISEQFWKNIEMPELEKRKAELLKKRVMNSYSSQHIVEHAKWYESVKNDHKQKIEKDVGTMSADRKFNNIEGTITIWQQRLKAEEKLQKEIKQKEHQDLLKKINKRTQYASLVKEMYPPTIDSSKHKEIETRKMKSTESDKVFNKPAPVVNENPDWKPHKFKPNKMIPEKKEPKKIEEKIDYLRINKEGRVKGDEERKEEMTEEAFKVNFEELESLSDGQKVKALQKISKRLEKEIRKKEIVGGKSQLNIKETDEINEMLIRNIKAKLNLLEKN